MLNMPCNKRQTQQGSKWNISAMGREESGNLLVAFLFTESREPGWSSGGWCLGDMVLLPQRLLWRACLDQFR
jgi:hypothetical protein